MHELSLSINTVDAVVAHAKAQGFHKVTLVELDIGALSCIESQALATGFEFACRETIAEGARLKINHIKATACCSHCKKNIELQQRDMCCPLCGGYQLAIETGEELKIKQIEVA
ncbi:TPA: hydrogenase maturation nickel metallochaperone HypA [Photobacterium damselae]